MKTRISELPKQLPSMQALFGFLGFQNPSFGGKVMGEGDAMCVNPPLMEQVSPRLHPRQPYSHPVVQT